MHLIIDGYSSNQRILRDEDFLRKWLENYPARYMGPVLEDWGISGFVFIAESHIGIHTFVEQNYINIDIFSCKDFDTEKAIEDCREGFQLAKLRTCLIDREWPKAEPAMANPQRFVYHE